MQSVVSRLDFAVYSSVVPMFIQHLLSGEDNRRATPHIPGSQNRGRLSDITPDTQTKQNSGECKMQRWIKCDNPPPHDGCLVRKLGGKGTQRR